MLFPDKTTRHLFFTGKGGVGKTSIACATAVHLADSGASVLLVSTDPASNLSQVLGVEITGDKPVPIPAVGGLMALNIDPEAAARAYRDRIIGPVRNVLPPETVRKMEEELSGACTTEIAAFDEFTSLIGGGEDGDGHDHVIFDTAPTGHTLRLLKLPTAWTGYLDGNTSGATCIGPLAGLEKQRDLYRRAVSILADAERTTVFLVTRPRRAPLREAGRTSKELRDLGITNQRLIVNGCMPGESSNDPLARAMVEWDNAAMAELPPELEPLPRTSLPLKPMNIVGVETLRGMFDDNEALPPSQNPAIRATLPENLSDATLTKMVDGIEADGKGLVMVMGKGGVGKTTIAAAIAMELARRGHAVHLSTTDPAAHVVDAVNGVVEKLHVSRIDPEVETARYRESIMKANGKGLDEAGLALLEEDLRSPCTEEIAVFQAFSRTIRESQKKFIIMDTAPTGHTLLLLDATGSYHREILRNAKEGARVTTPMMRLQDTSQTKMILVAHAETTPVHEAASLQEDLRRAGIEPWGWVINASLAAAGPTDPLLATRAHGELEQIEKVHGSLANRLAIVPWMPWEPVGAEKLHSLVSARTSE
ncbi:MAG: arsenical pump-driving ATPase [Candidatus Sumerlaeia bacterium]|nr:arsenical pump-driving ATPase [Candidatus Sumerlaeia bacterium]